MKTTSHTLIAFTSLFLVLSFSNRQAEQFTNNTTQYKPKPKSFEMDYDTFSIQHNLNKSIYFASFYWKDDSLHAVFSDTTGFYFFNISGRYYQNEVNLTSVDFETPKYVNIKHYLVHNADSIFILQDYALSLYSPNKPLKRWSINGGPGAKLNRQNYLIAFEHFPMYYDAHTHRFYLHQYCSKCVSLDKNFLKVPVEVFLDLNTGKTQALPVYLPKKLTELDYGFLGTYFDRRISFQKHLYSYLPIPYFELYDRQTQTSQTANVKSRFELEPTKPINKKEKDDVDRKLEHFSLENHYGAVIYDHHLKRYYRTFHPKLPLKNEEGLYHEMSDKKTILMIFDENLHLLDEQEIKIKNRGLHYAAPTPQGLLFFVGLDNEESKANSIHLTLLKIK